MTIKVDTSGLDDFVRRLKALDGMTIPIADTLNGDADYERSCPADECGSAFKVRWADWKDKVADGEAFCPYCRYRARASEFNTQEQQAHFAQASLAGIVNYLNGRTVSHISMPANIQEVMTLRIECEKCGCHYVVVGAGYFCPACGYNSADAMFDQTIVQVHTALDSITTIASAITDNDAAEQVRQIIVEGALKALVTAFQRFAEAAYPQLPSPTANPRPNDFQYLTKGSHLWHQAGGRAYAQILDAAEMADLIRYFQQRHVLEHQQGIVDQQYIDRSGDAIYAVGRRLVVREQPVVRLADLLTKLVDAMRADIPLRASGE